MNVLSLFDGISCGQIALNKLGIKYNKYYASEIDKDAISITMKNYPNTIQLGDVTKLDSTSLNKIDLLIGGSPCQGFSTAGKMLNFEDPRSKLFFDYVRILKETNPKYFLLENVRMKQKDIDIISSYLDVKPIYINSSLFSSQDRKRLYWTNIPNVNIDNIQNKEIYIKDILEENVSDSFYLSEKISNRYYHNPNFIEDKRKSCVLGKLSEYQGDRIFSIECKGSSLSAGGGNNGAGGCNLIFDPITNKIRKLTAIECERLQTVPDNYTLLDGVNYNKRYKMLGNGWTVDVISYIFSFII